MKRRKESVVLFSLVKANMDLTGVEFVHIFENDIILVNSQIGGKKSFFCQAVNPYSFFFLFYLKNDITWHNSSKRRAFGRQIP